LPDLLTPWTASDYYPVVRDEGARKLASSGVAPLIAVARGYRTIDNANLKESLSALALTGTQSWGRRIKQMTPEGEDVLLLPWYNAAQVLERGQEARVASRQLRPSSPLTNSEGKLAKYEFLAGQSTVLDFHPSLPAEWIEKAPRLLFTEGVVKGDSALTALLLEAGVTPDELKVTGASQNAQFARAMLNDLLHTRVPASKRVAILSFAGVANWRSHSEWRTINLADREIWVAFDGDVSTNRNVWKQAQDLWSFITDTKKGKPRLLDLGGLDASAQKLAVGLDDEDKLGLDDYLTQVGGWNDVKSLLVDELPAEPNKGETKAASENSVRVTEDGNSVQQWSRSQAEDGGNIYSWKTIADIGGRVVAAETRRTPTSGEVEEGSIDHELDDEQSESNCEIEVSWLDANGEQRTRSIRGSSNLLTMTPSEWHKHADIPTDILLIPTWPPAKGREWLEAVKAHRADETDLKTTWNVMGWVPVAGGHPAYIIGNQILVADGTDKDSVRAGVVERTSPGSSRFGVIDIRHEFATEAEYKAQVVEDIRTVTSMYIESGVWKNKSIAAAVVAAMLRPTLPVLAHAVLYFYGPPRSGKTLSAGFMMGGWQCSLGTWSADRLPGQATDTKPAIEDALAHSVIWVADDLPPSVDKRKAEGDEAKIADIIRAAHNGAGRRKMNGVGGVGVSEPRALFTITAENEPTVPSVRDRVLLLNTPPGEAFGEQPLIDALIDLNAEDGAPARLTAHMIRYWLNAEADPWKDRVSDLKSTLDDEVLKQCKDYLTSRYNISSGEATRHAKMASDLALSFVVLGQLASWAGIDEDDPIMAKTSYTDGSWLFDVFELAAQGITRQRSSSPGATLIECIAGVLRLGKGHLLNAGDPAQPPFSEDNASIMNKLVGWVPESGGAGTRTVGDTLGYIMTDAETDEKFVIFFPEDAFTAAQRQYPSRILYGQNAKVAWDTVWSEKLTTPSRTRVSGRNPQFRIGGRVVRGVPVRLDALLGGTEVEESAVG